MPATENRLYARRQDPSAEELIAGADRTTASRLDIVNVTKRFRGTATPAVESLNLSVESGQFLVLLGASGSGKTTTLMMVAGFVQPDDGDIQLGSRSIVNVPPESRNIGVVFQNYALFPHMTVQENVRFPLQMRRVRHQDADRRVFSILEMVGLSGMARRYPHQLSGGQQQRVALARALVFRPSILLMDEPLGALDRQLRGRMQQEIREIHREVGATTLYVTHDQDEALTMADRVAVLREGRLEQMATPQNLFDRPKNRFVASFVGECNFLSARVEGNSSAGWDVDLDGYRGHCEGSGPEPSRPATLAIRPHVLRVSDEGHPGVAGAVIDTLFVGDSEEILVRLDQGESVTIRRVTGEAATRFPPGTRVTVSWSWRNALVL